MKTVSRRWVFFLTYLTIAGSLWTVSEWWEKALATKLGADTISLNGCYRVERFKPRWVLPDIFHRESDPNEDTEPKWFPLWGYPEFYRLYNNHTGALIGESKIYDLQYTSEPLDWGYPSIPKVTAGIIYIGPNFPECIGDQPIAVDPKK
ncbi:hypothetical protein [Pseudomonas coronafaciens]|uniref:hypothetical protein n=1 Tax=Pseudomonas coronafaciens TaxID=53409 RepID=UPI0009BDF922|nr:hypothetical protein [Pseudomonas coronafaciens]